MNVSPSQAHLACVVFFFFSSRRRHTRCSRDWSSDVCSSDLSERDRVHGAAPRAGAAVHVVARRPILWLPPDRANERTRLERMLAPNASIAPGWRNWILEHFPYLFYRFPQDSKDRYNGNYVSGATDWLRERVIGKATLHEGHTVVEATEVDGRVAATISDGTTVRADHAILATGYRVDLNKLTMLHPSLLSDVKTDRAIPILSPSFESSVAG